MGQDVGFRVRYVMADQSNISLEGSTHSFFWSFPNTQPTGNLYPNLFIYVNIPVKYTAKVNELYLPLLRLCSPYHPTRQIPSLSQKRRPYRACSAGVRPSGRSSSGGVTATRPAEHQVDLFAGDHREGGRGGQKRPLPLLQVLSGVCPAGCPVLPSPSPKLAGPSPPRGRGLGAAGTLRLRYLVLVAASLTRPPGSGGSGGGSCSRCFHVRPAGALSPHTGRLGPPRSARIRARGSGAAAQAAPPFRGGPRGPPRSPFRAPPFRPSDVSPGLFSHSPRISQPWRSGRSPESPVREPRPQPRFSALSVRLSRPDTQSKMAPAVNGRAPQPHLPPLPALASRRARARGAQEPPSRRLLEEIGGPAPRL
ncbi:gametogenetin-like [Gracilinanus agilis]|uniref:gametogenetin-like n=1 Tax=Gracilinanus agilis TaxID=191870 RepID=UPI001CFCD7D2|nr:gametogenetin-like [Gracilinanus agilis]